eukprot:9212738-Pyramimonas_sp.AAC.2
MENIEREPLSPCPGLHQLALMTGQSQANTPFLSSGHSWPGALGVNRAKYREGALVVVAGPPPT